MARGRGAAIHVVAAVTLSDVLAAQLSVTCDGTAWAVKLTPDTDVFSTFTSAVEG